MVAIGSPSRLLGAPCDLSAPSSSSSMLADRVAMTSELLLARVRGVKMVAKASGVIILGKLDVTESGR